ncbi:MAG: sigma-70 family RNA polymerase sigma factor [Ignavibacteria bacterium]|nr:sigma-70 family RNA polymerase sigma factor [Ignavibacteria bacterium]
MNNSIVNSDQNLKKLYSEFESEALPHLNALQSYALKLTNDPEEADDLVQDTMLKAFRFFDKFEKGTNCKAWLFQIMKNSFINNYRKSSKEPDKVDYEDVQNFYENIKSDDVKSSHFEDDAFNDILDDEIVSALSTLPDDFRTIVFLSDIEGYSYEEIADFLDCPIGTVRSRLHRARKMLYALLYTYASDKGFVNEEKIPNKKKVEKNSKKQLINLVR